MSRVLREKEGTAAVRVSFPMSGRQSGGKRKEATHEEHSERQDTDRERGLDKAAVKEFVLSTLVRDDRLGSEFLTDVEKQQWEQWLASEPDSAAQVSRADWPLPIQMPRKCVPRQAGGSRGETSVSAQQEIIAYSNSDGRQFSRAARSRQYEQSRRLSASDMPVGSTVAIKRGEQVIRQPGYGTPFYLGDVLEVQAGPDGYVESFQLHYRMPVGAGQLFCDVLSHSWRLACHAHHVHDGQCKRRVACREAAAKAGSNDTRITHSGVWQEVLETQMAFNKSGTLKVESKRRIAQSAPQLSFPLTVPQHC